MVGCGQLGHLHKRFPTGVEFGVEFLEDLVPSGAPLGICEMRRAVLYRLRIWREEATLLEKFKQIASTSRAAPKLPSLKARASAFNGLRFILASLNVQVC